MICYLPIAFYIHIPPAIRLLIHPFNRSILYLVYKYIHWNSINYKRICIFIYLSRSTFVWDACVVCIWLVSILFRSVYLVKTDQVYIFLYIFQKNTAFLFKIRRSRVIVNRFYIFVIFVAKSTWYVSIWYTIWDTFYFTARWLFVGCSLHCWWWGNLQ